MLAFAKRRSNVANASPAMRLCTGFSGMPSAGGTKVKAFRPGSGSCGCEASADYGLLAALLMPNPTSPIIARIRGILADHNAFEEGPVDCIKCVTNWPAQKLDRSRLVSVSHQLNVMPILIVLRR